MTPRIAAALVMLVALAASPQAQEAKPSAPDREITHVRGDLYMVRDGRHHTVFVATAEGIVLGDPLSATTAEWLKTEFESRFPGVPVRSVVVTHHHYRRAEGLVLFTGATELVAQERYKSALGHARREFDPELIALDRDRNGALDQKEMAASPDRVALAGRDRNKDGKLTPSELYARVSDVERHFDTSWRIAVGGNVVEMVHVGSAHAPEMSLVFFPKERIVFAADIPPLTLQNGFGAFAPRDAMAWAGAVDALDFDTMLTSDGRRVSHADVTALQRYITDLLDAVANGYEAGRTAANLQASATLDAYRGTPFYPGQQAQIAAAFADLRLRTVDLYGVAMGRMVFSDARFCADYSACDQTTRVGGATVGLRTNVWRVGLVAEAMFGAQQRESTRTTPWSFEHMVHRDTRGSLLASLGSLSGGFDLTALAGVSLTVTDTRGLDIARAVTPVGGRRPIATRDYQYGLTVGADMSVHIGGKFAFLVPLRLTRNATWFNENTIGVEPLDVQVGVGLTMRVSSRVRRPH
jgi:glyoxylase-like metal-dependent hydrolase (beta-lactamase superfamily II)